MINQLGVFIDKHHRLIRSGLYVISFTGLIIVIRNTHTLKVYREIAAIPARAIQQQHLLRGVVRSIHQDGSISVAHQPMIFCNLIQANENETLRMRLAGIQPHKGFSEHMENAVMGKQIRFSLLNQNSDVADGILYTPGRWLLSRRSCLNEAVIQEGVGVVTLMSSSEMMRPDVYDTLTRTLLAVEVRADRKGQKGIWKRPSKLQKWKDWIRSWYR